MNLGYIRFKDVERGMKELFTITDKPNMYELLVSIIEREMS